MELNLYVLTPQFKQDIQEIKAALADLPRLHNAVNALQRGQTGMALDLTRIQTAVGAQKTVDDSVKALLVELAGEIRAAGTDQAALDALATSMEGENAGLVQAVTDNTPAAPPTPA